MDVHNIQIGDIILSSYGFMKDKELYGKIIAIFSDGLIFFDYINNVNEEYEEVFSDSISEIPISNESLLNIGFTNDGNDNFVKDTINGKGKVVISSTNSYVELANSDIRTSIPFTLYSILEGNTLHMLQRAVREILKDEIA